MIVGLHAEGIPVVVCLITGNQFGVQVKNGLFLFFYLTYRKQWGGDREVAWKCQGGGGEYAGRRKGTVGKEWGIVGELLGKRRISAQDMFPKDTVAIPGPSETDQFVFLVHIQVLDRVVQADTRIDSGGRGNRIPDRPCPTGLFEGIEDAPLIGSSLPVLLDDSAGACQHMSQSIPLGVRDLR